MVAEKCDSRRISPLSRRCRRQSHFSAKVSLFCDTVDRALGHRPLVSIQLCLVLLPPSSPAVLVSCCPCTFRFPDLFFQVFLGHLFPLWPCGVHCSACLSSFFLLTRVQAGIRRVNRKQQLFAGGQLIADKLVARHLFAETMYSQVPFPSSYLVYHSLLTITVSFFVGL